MQIIHVDEEDANGKWQAGVRLLEFDSKLFGFPVAQLDPFISGSRPAPLSPVSPVGKSVVDKCLAEAAKAGVRQISVAVAPDDTAGQIVLADSGFRLADTIVTYSLDLSGLAVAGSAEQYVRAGRESDIDAVAAISSECFGNRAYNVNRFNSDPIFPEDKVRKLYDTWARNSFNGEAADMVFVYEDNGEVLGFITCRLSSTSGSIPLNAVRPDCQGRGIYMRLVKSALSWLAKNGAITAEIKTQISNTAVERTWENLGGNLASACHRFHRSL